MRRRHEGHRGIGREFDSGRDVQPLAIGFYADRPQRRLQEYLARVKISRIFNPDGVIGLEQSLGDELECAERAGRNQYLIGRAGDADDGSGGQVDFILMIESKNVNPEVWLRH